VKLAIIAAAVVLAGCQCDPIIKEKEVKVPVPVKCQTPDPTAPALKFKPPYADVFQGTKDLLGDRELMLAYENELVIAFKSCK
jgi:hypothetical protein